MFSLLPGDQLQAPVLAAELASRTTIECVVAIVGEDHDSRCFMSELNRSLARYAVAPKFQFVYRPSKTAVVELVSRSLQAQPDAVVLVADATGTAQLVGQLRRAGFAGDVFAGPSLGRRRCQQQLDKSAENVVFPLLLEPGKRWPEFAKAFRTRYGHSPDYAAASTFDAVQLLVAAIGHGGLNRARIGDAIRQLSPWQGVAGVAKWDPLGGNLRPVRLGAINGGRVSVVSVKKSSPQSRGGAKNDSRD
jgi:ABC-type branched-subunit amino acid transport system substrate-binding protein